jgi:opacity protein-like surface antigen
LTGRHLFVATVAVAGCLSTSLPAAAQSPSRQVEGAVFPGSVIVFREEAGGAPAFNSFATFGTVTVNLTEAMAVEGEFGVNFGFDQEIDFVLDAPESRPPTMVVYGASVVAHLVPNDLSGVPYVIAGAGGLTLTERPELGVTKSATFFTLNAGVGAKFNVTAYWGIRIEYRFIAVVSNDGAPEFFGRDNRFGHRLAAGITFGGGR